MGPTEMREIIAAARTIWGPLIMTNIQENAFVLGQSFSYEDYLTYAAAGVKDFIFDPTAFDGTNLVVLPPSFSATAGPVTVEYYAGVAETGDGTPLGISNRRNKFKNARYNIKIKPDNYFKHRDTFHGAFSSSNGSESGQ